MKYLTRQDLQKRNRERILPILIPHLFYRVGNVETNQGLWYDNKGNFTGDIHKKFDFCKNSKLPMPYNPEIIGFLSAVNKIEDLSEWFSIEDLKNLGKHG